MAKNRFVKGEPAKEFMRERRRPGANRNPGTNVGGGRVRGATKLANRDILGIQKDSRQRVAKANKLIAKKKSKRPKPQRVARNAVKTATQQAAAAFLGRDRRIK